MRRYSSSHWCQNVLDMLQLVRSGVHQEPLTYKWKVSHGRWCLVMPFLWVPMCDNWGFPQEWKNSKMSTVLALALHNSSSYFTLYRGSYKVLLRACRLFFVFYTLWVVSWDKKIFLLCVSLKDILFPEVLWLQHAFWCIHQFLIPMRNMRNILAGPWGPPLGRHKWQCNIPYHRKTVGCI